MSFEKWLITSAGKVVDFDQDSDFLSSLFKIDKVINDLPNPFDGLNVDDAIDVVKLLQKGHNEHLATVLDTLQIDHTVLFNQTKLFLGDLDEQDIEDFEMLLKTFEGLRGTPVERVWPLLDEKADDNIDLSDALVLKLNTKAGLKLAIKALAALPKDVDSDPSRSVVLRLGLSGNIAAGANLNVAHGPVTAGLGVGLVASADITYFYLHRTLHRIGKALVNDFSRLSSPFDVVSLKQRLVQDNLAAIKIQADHEASISGQVGFKKDLDLTEKVSGEVGISFGFSKSISGKFNYLIRANESGHLVIDLKRVAASQDEQSSSLGLTIDMTKWAEKVYPEIRSSLGEAEKLLDKVDDLVPGKDTFKELVGTELGKGLGDFEFKQQVLNGLGLLGTGNNDELCDLLLAALLDKVQSASKLWVGKAEDRAKAIKNEIISELEQEANLSTDVLNRLDGVLKQGLADGLQKLDQALIDKLKKLVTGSSFKPFVNIVNDLGNDVSDQIRTINDRVNAVTQPVKQKLDDIQVLVNKLKEKFADASKAKIAIGLSSLHRENESDTLSLQLVLNPSHTSAQKVLNSVLTADLDSLFKDVVFHNKMKDVMQPIVSSPIIKMRGTLTRYAALHDERGFTAVLFGHGLSGTTKVDANAKLVIDASGNIQALTSAEYNKTYNSLQDNRELKVFDAIELATASQHRSATLGTNLTLNDDDLTVKNIQRFFRSGELAGVLPRGVAAKAKTELAGIEELNPARLDVGLTLTGPQLQRMLSIEDPALGLAQQPAVDEERIFAFARHNVAKICREQPPEDGFIERLAFLRNELGLGNNLDKMIEAMTRFRLEDAEGDLESIDELNDVEKLNAATDLSWVWYRHKSVLGCHNECVEGRPRVSRGTFLDELDEDVGDTQNEVNGLVDAIKGMREVYFAQEEVENWNVEALRAMQAGIGESFKPWFELEGAFFKWWLLDDKRVRPLTLAFFKTLIDLAEPGGLTMSAKITLVNAKGETRKSIILT